MRVDAVASIELDDVHVDLPVFDMRARSLRGVLERFGRGHGSHGVVVVPALRGIGLTLRSGDRLGLLGRNGAGKSTLLRVMAGIYRPTRGQVVRRGRVVPLFDLALGLDDHATGRQNIRLRGLFLGMPPSWVERCTPQIEDFAELGEHLDMPVRTYSAGMRMRLAFSISMAVHGDILLLDEVFGVGDAAFQRKASARLHEVTAAAGIVVMALHSSSTIAQMCNKALWLHDGRIRQFGDCAQVVQAYDAFMLG